MRSSLSNACTIKLQNFEGPFDLLFYLIEKNKVNIYDIPINEITDQYLDYQYSMQEMDMEVASEFLVMASTLLHIKSRLLLPDRKTEEDNELDAREELITSLIRYKRYKEFAETLREREMYWSGSFYRPSGFTEVNGGRDMEFVADMSAGELLRTYISVMRRYNERMNKNSEKIRHILTRERVTVTSKIREISQLLFKRTYFIFNEWFSLKRKSKLEIVTGFIALLQLAKMKKIRLVQKDLFGDIRVEKLRD